jgi:hypothetical protein
MPLPVLPDTFQAVIDWSATGGQTAKNVMYFAFTESGDDAALAAALDDNVTANMFHTISSEASAATCSIRAMDGEAAPQPFPLTNWNGTEGEEWVPATACCLTLYTAVSGRTNRGRLYLPFTAESVQDDGLFIGDASTVVTPAWNAFLTAMAADGWVMVVASLITEHTHTVHNEDGSVTRGVPVGAAVPHTNPVTRIAQQVVVATQRRRQSRLRTS